LHLRLTPDDTVVNCGFLALTRDPKTARTLSRLAGEGHRRLRRWGEGRSSGPGQIANQLGKPNAIALPCRLTLSNEFAKIAAMKITARSRHRIASTLWAVCLLGVVCQQALAQEAEPPAHSLAATASPLVWLLPLGVTLAAMGLRRATAAREALVALPLAWALALVGYSASGFALQFGSLGLISAEPGLENLTAQWSPLALWLGEGWGLAGLRGFAFPLYEAGEPQRALFLAQLPLVVTATLLPLVALRGRIPALPQALLALWVAAVAYPLMGHWLQGGGWLAQVGRTLSLGRGVADASLASLFFVGGMAALAGLVAFRGLGSESSPSTPAELPEAHLPLYLLIGALLAWIGWLAYLQGNPLTSAEASSSGALLNSLWATAGAVLTAALYGWLIHGEIDAGLLGRSLLAAMVAVAPGAPWFDWYVALLLGAACGLLLAPTIYLVERILGCDDRATAVSTLACPAAWGLLAVGLFARGDVVGWWMGDHVAGLAQFLAQLVGVGALGLMAGLVPWCLLALIAQGYAFHRGRHVPQTQPGPSPAPATHAQRRAYANHIRSIAHPRRLPTERRHSRALVRPVGSRRRAR
jgi:Amt family ammonium transporter